MFISLLLAPLFGQAGKPEPARTFRLLSVVGSFSDLRFENAGNTINPRVTRTPSQPYPIPPGGKLAIYRLIPSPPDSPPGAPAFVKAPVADIAIPASLPRALIFLSPAPDGKLASLVVPDDPDKHPAGTLRMLNFSSSPAAISLNRDTRQISSGTSELVTVPSGGGLALIAVQNGRAWDLAFRKERKFRPDSRYYIVVFDYARDPEIEETPPLPPALVRLFGESVPVK